MSTNNISNSWFSVSIIPCGYRFKPTSYLIRNQNYTGWVLRNWIFEGCNDGSTWKVISTHVNDTKLEIRTIQ